MRYVTERSSSWGAVRHPFQATRRADGAFAEIHFELDGSRGFLEALRHRIALRKYAVIVVAEGAGQALGDQIGRYRSLWKPPTR